MASVGTLTLSTQSKTATWSFDASTGLSMETPENFGVVTKNGLFIERTGTLQELLVVQAASAPRLVSGYDSTNTTTWINAAGTVESPHAFHVHSIGRVEVYSSNDEVELWSAGDAVVRSATGIARLTSPQAAAQVLGTTHVLIDSDDEVDVKGEGHISAVFAKDGTANASFRVRTGYQPSSGPVQTINLVTVDATGVVQFRWIDHASGDDGGALAVKPHNPGNIANHFDAVFEVGIGVETRGVLEVFNEPGGNRRAGVLKLYDQDDVPWFL